MNFKIKNKTRDFSPLIERCLAGVKKQGGDLEKIPGLQDLKFLKVLSRP